MKSILLTTAVLGSLALGGCSTQKIISKPRAPGETRVIHVSNSGSDDIGIGTEDHPYATLSKAVLDLAPGDRVVLHPGRYPRTSAVVTASGTEKDPISIEGAAGGKVILQGLGVDKGTSVEEEDKSKIASVVDIRDSRHIVVKNLEVEDSAGFGISVWNSEDVSVIGCVIHHTWSRGLGGSGVHLLFQNNEVFDTVLQNENESVLQDQDRGVKRSWSAAAATWYRPNKLPSMDITWRGNKIRESWGEGISALHADGVRIEHNEVSDTYGPLIYIDHSRNVLVDSNWVRNTSRAHTRREERDVSNGIMFASENYSGTAPFALKNIKITNNVIANVAVGVGFWRDPANSGTENRYEDVLIAHNLIKDTSTMAISIDKLPPEALALAKGRIVNNIIYEPDFAWKQYQAPMTLLILDPASWKDENNLYPNELVGSGGFSFDPKLADPRAVSSFGIRGFMPLCQSLEQLKKGRPLEEVSSDFDDNPRSRSNPAIGPWENCVNP